MKITRQELREHFKGYQGKLIGNLPPWDYYDIMINYIEKDNYLQIIYGMGVVYLLIILDFFEEREQYEYCAKIRDTIGNHKMVSGDNTKMRLE